MPSTMRRGRLCLWNKGLLGDAGLCVILEGGQGAGSVLSGYPVAEDSWTPHLVATSNGKSTVSRPNPLILNEIPFRANAALHRHPASNRRIGVLWTPIRLRKNSDSFMEREGHNVQCREY